MSYLIIQSEKTASSQLPFWISSSQITSSDIPVLASVTIELYPSPMETSACRSTVSLQASIMQWHRPALSMEVAHIWDQVRSGGSLCYIFIENQTLLAAGSVGFRIFCNFTKLILIIVWKLIGYKDNCNWFLTNCQ